MTTTFPTLKEQQKAGLWATLALKEATQMLDAITAWDALTPAEKAREYADHFNPDCAPSRFYEVPGFEPVGCVQCDDDVFPDYREDPEGLCPFGADHMLWTHGLSDRAAA